MEKDIKVCFNILQVNNIWDDNIEKLKKNFKIFALKNHPDKGGIKEIFQSVSNCKDILVNNFEEFKSIAYGEEQDNDDLELDSEYEEYEEYEEYIPKKKSKSTKKHEFKKDDVKIDINIFKMKSCNSGRGGWLANELRNFCIILNINSVGNKSELCGKLSNFFNKVQSTKQLSRSNKLIKNL